MLVTWLTAVTRGGTSGYKWTIKKRNKSFLFSCFFLWYTSLYYRVTYQVCIIYIPSLSRSRSWIRLSFSYSANSHVKTQHNYRYKSSANADTHFLCTNSLLNDDLIMAIAFQVDIGCSKEWHCQIVHSHLACKKSHGRPESWLETFYLWRSFLLHSRIWYVYVLIMTYRSHIQYSSIYTFSCLPLSLFVLVSGTFPIDTTKTRLQIQGQKLDGRFTTVRYNGMFHALSRITREEGVRALYSGY